METGTTICPICDQDAQIFRVFSSREAGIECNICGKFFATDGDRDSFFRIDDNTKVAIQSFIREKNIDEIEPHLNEVNFQNLPKISKTPIERIDMFLLNLEKIADGNFSHNFEIWYDNDAPLAHAKNGNEMHYILKVMEEMRMFASQYFAEQNVNMMFCLSVDAWQRIDEIKKGNPNSNQGFVACWFHDSHDKYRRAAEKGIECAGFKAISIKEKHYPETIIAKALGEIRKSRFLIADLTKQRSTVFVEIGFALGLGIDVFFIVSKKYWEDEKDNLEFYSKNYNIKAYKDEKHLSEIVEEAIRSHIESR